MGDTGFEPVTSSVSRKRATAAPIARVLSCAARWVRDLNPCTRICSPLPRLSANPPWRFRLTGETFRADNETRTRDLNLGKVALYQLSYVRLQFEAVSPASSASGTVVHGSDGAKIAPRIACPTGP